MNKKTFIIIGSSIIGVIIVILLILWLLTVIKGHYTTYEKVEDKMIDATKSYYKTYPEKLPSKNGKSTLSYETLVESKKIKPLNELLKDGDTCKAEIEVIKNDNNYDYMPRLTCSDKYSTKTLVDQILSNNDIVNQGSGLYKYNDEYYFKGKINNNYVSFGTSASSDKNILWQIISIDKNNNIKMRSIEKTERSFFDTRYNIDKDTNFGYNTLENSEFSDYLKSLEEKELFLKKGFETKLVKTKLCTNKRSIYDKSKDGSTECASLSNDSYLYSTLLPYEFLRASLDTNCIDAESRSCSNLNFLTEYSSSSTWTITPDANTSYKLFVYDLSGLALTNASNEKSIYPVVLLSQFAQFKSGDGTLNNPYIVK